MAASQSSLSRPSASQIPATQPLRRLSDRFEEEQNNAVIDVDDVQDELYCMVKVPVVGLQYYTGLVGAGEEVRLVREPHNKYDRNAIQVKNIGGTQVGHVKREYAARLAPLLDQGLITVEGVMQEGNRASLNPLCIRSCLVIRHNHSEGQALSAEHVRRVFRARLHDRLSSAISGRSRSTALVVREHF